MKRQGMAEVSTCMGFDASLLAHQLDGWLVLEDTLQMADRVQLAEILTADDSLWNLSTFDLVESHLFTVGGRQDLEVTELFRIIERLDYLHIELRGMLMYPHISMTMMFDL